MKQTCICLIYYISFIIKRRLDKCQRIFTLFFIFIQYTLYLYIFFSRSVPFISLLNLIYISFFLEGVFIHIFIAE